MKNEKINAPIIGADSNIFNIVAICTRQLKRNNMNEQSDEMVNRVLNAKNYDEALSIVMEYVNPIDVNEKIENSSINI